MWLFPYGVAMVWLFPLRVGLFQDNASPRTPRTACPLPNWARGQATEFFHEEAEELAIEVMKAVNNK